MNIFMHMFKARLNGALGNLVFLLDLVADNPACGRGVGT